MSDSGWSRLAALYDELQESEPTRRAARLGELGKSDPQLAAELAELLTAEEEPGFSLEPGAGRGILWRELLGGKVLQPPMPLEGSIAGRYRLLREVGRGGMSVVFLAEHIDPAIPQEVAVKVLHAGIGDEASRARFERELAILARLSHPSIARFLDGGVMQDGRPFLAMEYVDGRSIQEHCDRLRLPIEERLLLFEEAAQAVAYAHRNLVVHRDLKPSNLLVTREGAVKLVDFGIAKLLDGEIPGAPVPSTVLAARLMTPEYASPEQVRGSDISTVSDVYQLGLLLYELLCGCRAHGLEGSSLADVEEAVCQRVPERPSAAGSPDQWQIASRARRLPVAALRRRLRGDLDTIVMTALRKEPDARYPSVDRMLDDLRRHRANRPLRARHNDLTYRTRRFVRRNWLAVALALAVVLLLAGYGTLATVQSREIGRQRDRAESQVDRAFAVKDFLSQVIAAHADPELLDVAAGRIDGLDHRPEVKAEMALTLGNLNLGFGRVEQARPLLEESLALRFDLLGSDSVEALESRVSLAQALESLGQMKQALEHYELVTRILREGGPEMEARLGYVQQSRGGLATIVGEYELADRSLDEALTTRRHRSAEYVERLRSRQGSTEPGLEVIFPGRFPHLLLARTLRRVADLETRRGGFLRAEALLQEALELDRLEPSYVPSHTETLYLTGRLHWKRGSLEEAEILLARMLELYADYSGREKSFVTAARLDRTRVLLGLQRLDEAQDQLSEARTAWSEEHSVDPVLRPELHQTSARLAWAEGALEEAEEELRTAIAGVRTWGFPEAPRLAELRLDLALLLDQADRRGEARELLRAATPPLEKRLSEDHPVRRRLQEAREQLWPAGG
ncbi:MAG: serine/threonine-protein kinase [Thermoanaerobaculia bacterium]|nr:serine/threonine-protein kinase [Thermoanaerobaculia bacterium]